MARKHDSWGIEVGTNAIKAIHLTRAGAKGKVQMTAHEVLPFKRVLTTPDLNVEEAVQVNLDQLLSRHDLSKSTVSISVPGHMAFARFAKLPPVEPKKIPSIVEFEAKQQIPFPIEQVEWDYQIFQQDDAPDVEVGIFAITKEKVMSYLSNYNSVNMRVDTLTLSPLAVFNAFVYDKAEDPEPEGVIYLDIGTTATDVIIVEEGGIWLRTLPLGGNTFTEALVKAFKLSYNKAEKLKKEAATSKYARQIFQAMRPVFADLVQELQRSLGYYQSLNRDANLTKLVGVGSTFKLPGLQKFLKQQLQIEVERPDGFNRIQVGDKHESEFADQALNLATAYGLALQGLGLETVSANIMPSHILNQRLWKAKQPWIAGAAACFVAAAGIGTGVIMKEAGAAEAGLAAGQKRSVPVLQVARGFKAQYDEIDTTSDPRQRIENLRRILNSRDIWPSLLEDINRACMALDPQPETITNNYKGIEGVPRSDRNRIYLQSITNVYEAGGEEASDETGAMNPMMMDPMSGMGGPEYGGGVGGPEYSGGMGGMDYSGMGGMSQGTVGATYTMGDFFAEGKTPPRMIVTLRGTTPNKDGSKFLEDKFVGWLKANADRPDKPYRFIVDENVIASFGPVVVEQADTSAGGMGGPGSTGRQNPGYTGGYGANPYGGGAPGAYGGAGSYSSGGSYGGASAGAGSTDLATLLPERPLSEEDRSGDFQFEIRWTVELLDPTATAASEESTPDQGEPPADGETPAEPVETPTAVIPANDDERGQS
jgi:type IV pilus assembly protein PilM